MQEGVWADYQVYAEQNKSTLKLTYATVVNSIVNVYQDGSMVATIDMPKTGDMNTLGMVEVAKVLSRGNHTLRIEVVKGGFNFYKLAN